MSIHAIVMVLDFAPQHWNSGTRIVAMALADRVNKDEGNTCWPSLADIQERTGLSERMVRYHLRYLEEEGWIERGGHKTNACGQPVNNVWIWRKWLGGGGQPIAPGGGQWVAPLHRGGGGQPIAPELLSLNHKQEPLAKPVGKSHA